MSKQESPKKSSAFERFILKPILRIFLALLLVLVLALTLFLIFPGPVSELVVEHVVSRILGVKITVDNIDVHLTRGRVELRSFTIYNPEDKGYVSENAIHLGHVDAEIDPLSLVRGKKIIIRDLTLKDIAIHYEADLLFNSNLQDIIDNINRLKAEEEEEAKQGVEEKGLEVDRFVMDNVGLYIVAKGVPARAGIPLTIDPMGPVGQDSPEGVSPVSFALSVMSTILVDASKQAGIKISAAALDAANTVVSASTDAVGKAADHVTEQSQKAVDHVTEQGKKAVESIKGIF